MLAAQAFRRLRRRSPPQVSHFHNAVPVPYRGIRCPKNLPAQMDAFDNLQASTGNQSVSRLNPGYAAVAAAIGLGGTFQNFP